METDMCPGGDGDPVARGQDQVLRQRLHCCPDRQPAPAPLAGEIDVKFVPDVSSSPSFWTPLFALSWAIALSVIRLVVSLSSWLSAAWASFRRRRDGCDLKLISSLRRGDGMRLPVHLAIVVQEVSASGAEWLSDLSSLVVWCVVVGIPFVSIYDAAGVVKKEEEKLGELVIGKQKAYLGHDFARYRVKSSCVKMDYGYTNGVQVVHWTTLDVVGPSDCKPSVMAAVRRMAASRALSTKPPSAVTTTTTMALGDEFERELCASSVSAEVAPEPDVAVTVGPVRTTAGFLPWHIRLTEIFRVPSVAALDESAFVEILRKFARCEQRFGT